jgi:hypothetical protein
MCIQRFAFTHVIQKGKKVYLRLFCLPDKKGSVPWGVRVDWTVSRVQEFHINIAGCKGLEGSKCQMVMIFKAGNNC